MNEAETALRFSDDGKEADMWSASDLFQQEMERLDIAPYKITTRLNGQKIGWYRVPKEWIQIKKPQVLTEEQRLMLLRRGRHWLRGTKKKGASESVDA